MKNSTQFAAWAAAAAAGLTLAACDGEKEAAPSHAEEHMAQVPAEAGEKAAAPKGDQECCIGKNDCKGKGGCAVPENNDCAGKNDCKGKGGCNMHCPK